MDSDLSSVEEFEDSAALVDSSEEEIHSEPENMAETYYRDGDEEMDDFPDEEEDEVEAEEDEYHEEVEYEPVTKRAATKVHKVRKPKRQAAVKQTKDTPIPSRQSSRVRKHVDYDQTINDEEFLEEALQEEEKPITIKKKKSKIELIEDDQDDLDDDDDLGGDEVDDGNGNENGDEIDDGENEEDLDEDLDDQEDVESPGFDAEDDDEIMNNGDEVDVDDTGADEDGVPGSPDYSTSETPETHAVKNQQRRSQMLENLIGFQAKRHGNRKELTEEEIQLRKAETTRKRKNFIEKRLEEEKQDVLNKLLKRRAAKTKSDPKAVDQTGSEDQSDVGYTKQKRPYITVGMTRTIINKSQITYSLP
ncbi:unnamed protein product [Kluyveromyces dobzhanskii CBS 2104]|uniref:WGS project CCBQ000000000 data, contig 00266 n=1 Tax=Kluyveromyces dobzhanskii CBS 2104 TaxID=1427455 RepID=A0A0A8L5B7_9SACH|nr:unnamed protein product [Kluyveromyces dobzhanskii CBS 2104]